MPVLIGLPEAHRPAFERFSEGMASTQPPDEAAILDWRRAMARMNADLPNEA